MSLTAEMIVNGFVFLVLILAAALISVLWYMFRKLMDKVDDLAKDVAEIKLRIGQWDGNERRLGGMR